MSVLLFMPESGGSPLDSIILTSNDGDSNEEAGATIRRSDLKNGKPGRKLSSDSASAAFSIQSAHLKTKGEDDDNDDDDDVSSLGADTSRISDDSSSSPPQRRRPLTRSRSAATSGTATSTKSAPPLTLHRTIADAKQPQLRLTPVGAMLGATGGAKMVKAVNKAQERRARQQQRDVDSVDSASLSMRVHCGFYV